MNHDELDTLLKQAKVPEPGGAYWEELPGRVVRRVHGATDRSTLKSRRRRTMQIARWITAAATCALAVLLTLNWWGSADQPGPIPPTATASNPIAPGNALQHDETIRELMELFPNQLRAVVQDQEGVRLVLAEEHNVPESTPVYVSLCRGRECMVVVTFSGQEVEVGGERITILSDAQGGVILVGERFLWSSREPVEMAGGLRIEAKELGYVSPG